MSLKVCACTLAKSAVTVQGATLAGTVHLFANTPAGIRSVTISVDGHKVSTLRAHKRRLPKLTLATAHLSDGPHTVAVSFALAHGATASGSASVTVANHASAQRLIATALALHGIDYGRSLLYRIYAFWDDDALPHAYRGTGSETEESIFLEAERAIAEHKLSAAERRELAPALVRPTSPSGIFVSHAHGHSHPHKHRRSHKHSSHTHPRLLPLGQPLAGLASAGCASPAGWQTQAGAKIRAWSESAGDLAPTLEAAEAALGAEEGDMGAPLPDGGGSAAACAEGNPDPLIDVYVVNPSSFIRGRTYAGHSKDFAITVPSNVQGNACSAYIMVNTELASPTGNTERLKDVLVHEMYHVLQFAHNCVVNASWFRESSAEWAEINYGPNNKISQGDVGENLENFQSQQPRSLTALPNPLAVYDDFIWPLFMNQEGTNPAQAWNALAGVTSEEGVLKAIDSAFSFKENLPTFALRDLQIPYSEEGGDDEAEQFQTAKTGGVPSLPTTQPVSYESYKYDTTITLIGTEEKEEEEPITLPGSLEVRYKTIDLPSKEELAKVTLNFSGLPDEVTPIALVHLEDGKWEERKMSGGKLEFCRDEEDGKIEGIIVALSNDSLEAEPPSDSHFTYKSAKECGTSGLTGSLDLSAEYSGNPEVHISGHVNVDVKDEPEGTKEESTYTLTAQIKGSRQVGDPPETEQYEGSYSTVVPPPMVVNNFGSHVEVFVVLTDTGSTTTTGGKGAEGACGGGPGTAEDGWDFIAGPYTIQTPAGSGSHTIQINNTEPFQFQFNVGTGCYGLPPGLSTTWQGSLTWTPPPPSG